MASTPQWRNSLGEDEELPCLANGVLVRTDVLPGEKRHFLDSCLRNHKNLDKYNNFSIE
jgi:hypothetical protein